MKINSLYILLPLALGACWWISTNLADQSTHTFFGTAENEPQILNFDHSATVQDLRVVVGQEVKRGDTLAILFQQDLDRTQLNRTAQIRHLETERSSKNQVLSQEKDLILAKKKAQLAKIDAEIRVLTTEDSLQSNLKSAMYPNQKQVANSPRQTQIAVLRQSVRDIENQATAELQNLQTQQAANAAIGKTATLEAQQDIQFVALDRNRLALIAPTDGFIEQVFVAKGAVVPSFKDMIKINPKTPNRIVGFIPESAVVPFQIGDTVFVNSYARPNLTPISTQIVGCSPKLVELPLRLRKFQELRAWGRELYLNLPSQNPFYIGEKLNITLKK